MKNLVFGALISALSFSVFAADYSAPVIAANESQHHATKLITVNIVSQGSDVQWEQCSPAELAQSGLSDGNSVTAGDSFGGGSFVFKNLHYGQSFAVCAKAILHGGYAALGFTGTQYSMKFDKFVDLTTGTGAYLTDSGLTVTYSLSCSKSKTTPNGQTFSFPWPVNSTPVTSGPAAVVDGNGGSNILVGGGFPDSCIIRATFSEDSSKGQRLLPSDSLKIDLNLDVSIDG